MSKHTTDHDAKALPKPMTLTPGEVQLVAAGVAAALPILQKPGTTWGMWPPEQAPILSMVAA